LVRWVKVGGFERSLKREILTPFFFEYGFHPKVRGYIFPVGSQAFKGVVWASQSAPGNMV